VVGEEEPWWGGGGAVEKEVVVRMSSSCGGGGGEEEVQLGLYLELNLRSSRARRWCCRCLVVQVLR
jgi:hypothetical protein